MYTLMVIVVCRRMFLKSSNQIGGFKNPVTNQKAQFQNHSPRESTIPPSVQPCHKPHFPQNNSIRIGIYTILHHEKLWHVYLWSRRRSWSVRRGAASISAMSSCAAAAAVAAAAATVGGENGTSEFDSRRPAVGSSPCARGAEPASASPCRRIPAINFHFFFSRRTLSYRRHYNFLRFCGAEFVG